MIGWRPHTTSTNTASTRLRCVLPMRYLASAGTPGEFADQSQPGRYSVLVAEKAYSEADLDLATRARASGAAVVFDLCDNHFLPRDEDRKDPARRERLARMLSLADVVTTCSDELARRIDHPRVLVVDDTLEDWSAVKPPGPITHFRNFRARMQRGARLVWFGAGGRIDPPFGLVDLERIRPELDTLHKRLPIVLDVITDSRDRAQETLRGAQFPWRFVRWRLDTFPHMLARAEIALLPVKIHEFTVGKSANRVLTALALGVPVVADPLASYRPLERFVRFGCTADTIEAYWRDEAARERDVEAARAHLKLEWGPERAVRQWSQAFTEARRARG
ncbi:MAG: hypothetical protein JNL28_12415 [Planctomycetes bacterium]|nr:hypothetical protein [Planctomycetota bacterium]